MEILKKGDIIGIVAPSSPVMGTDYEDQYKRGLLEIEKMGFKYKEGKTIFMKKWHFAGSDEERATDIMNMFLDNEVKAIICAVGGSGANRILDLLDFNIIKENVKPFMGISDPTVLTSGLFQLGGIPTVYGPDVCFGLGGDKSKDKKNWEIEMLKKLLTSENPIGIVKSLTKWKFLKKGAGKGRLLGGHLNSYKGLLGTPYFADIKKDSKILFWETTGSYLQMDEDLVNLKNSGFFKNVKGMIVGKFNLMDDDSENIEYEKNKEELILNIFKDYNFPIIINMDFGHDTPNIPLPYGKMAEINSDNSTFEILQSLF